MQSLHSIVAQLQQSGLHVERVQLMRQRQLTL